jgi:hypothetical protein
LEPEVAELRRLLTNAAESDVGAYRCYEHQNGGPVLSFVEPDHGLDSDVSGIDQLMHGIRRLWPLVQPISAEAVIGCLDSEFGYPDSGVKPRQPHWFIYDRSDAPHRTDDQRLDVVDPWHVDPVVEATSQLSAEVIRSWLERAQAQSSPAPRTHHVGWTDLWFNATRALVRHPHVPNYGQVELVIHANWSLWTEDGSPGRAALVEVARTLLADGWCIDQADQFFHELL